MAPPPSSLLRDLLVADGFKNRHKPPNGSAPAASRATSMSLNNRRPGKPVRAQSDVLTRSRLKEMNGSDPDGGGRDAAGGERRAATATHMPSASQTSARSYSNKGASDSGDAGAGARRGSASASAAAVPALDESALTALISLAAGPMKRFAKDEAFRASLRAGCTSCLGDSDHRTVLDLRVHAQTVERAARDSEGLDPRDLKRASGKLHEAASLADAAAGEDADAAAKAGVPYRRLAACAHVYISAASTLRRRDHSAAVHALEAFCLAPREARTLLLPALWDRLFRSGLSHLRAWRDRESAAASSDGRGKEVERTFADAVDEGTRKLACYYRDWLLGRTDAMALPDVPAPPGTVLAGATRCSASTSYDISSDVVFSSGGSSPAKFVYGGSMQRSDEIEEEDEVHVVKQDAGVESDSVFHECEAGEARSYAPALQAEESVPEPSSNLVNETVDLQVEDEPSKESYASTNYPLISDVPAIELLTLEFCAGPLQSETDGNHFSIFATVPSDFLCPLTRQIFNNPVTIETGQTFERHAIVQWLDTGFRTCPVTGQELLSSSIPDTNRVLKRLIDSWMSERCNCKNLVSGNGGPKEKLTVTIIDKVFDSAGDKSEKLDKARQLMAIDGIDFLLYKFQERGGDEQQRVAEHLLLCIRAEGSCRNYVAMKIDGSSVLRLLHSEVLSARRTAVGLLTELICLRRREMFELLLRGLGTESLMQTMDVLLEHLLSLSVQEQASVAVLLLRLDALVEPHKDNKYREEAAKIITRSLRCCMSEDNAVPSTWRALLLLAGHFSFSGDLLAEDWMLKQAGFADASRASPIRSDVVVQDTEAAGNEAWLRHAAAALVGTSGVRRPFLEALSRCLGSPDADLVGACLTTAGWLSRSLAAASLDDATGTDACPAAFSALVPRLKQCLAPARPARHRVLAAVSLHNFSNIPDCRELLVLLADGLRDHLAELAGMTRTAGQLSAELQERH